MASAILKSPLVTQHLVKQLLRSAQFNNGPMIMRMSYWNKDWKPGPYPRTEKERVAAAKKYNMLPEDYKPVPEGAYGLGDYPDLPVVPTDLKDPYEDWDYPHLKKNYGEPLHQMADVYGEDRLNPVSPNKFSWRTQLFTFFGIVGTLCTLVYIGEFIQISPPVMPKQYPNDGKPNYSFELKE